MRHAQSGHPDWALPSPKAPGPPTRQVRHTDGAHVDDRGESPVEEPPAMRTDGRSRTAGQRDPGQCVPPAPRGDVCRGLTRLTPHPLSPLGREVT